MKCHTPRPAPLWAVCLPVCVYVRGLVKIALSQSNLTKSSSKFYGNYKLCVFITKNLIKKTPNRKRASMQDIEGGIKGKEVSWPDRFYNSVLKLRFPSWEGWFIVSQKFAECGQRGKFIWLQLLPARKRERKSTH